MRAISRADLVSSPSDAALAVSVVRSLNSSAPRLTVFGVGACSSMVRVAIKYPAFLLTSFYSYGMGKALTKVCRRWYSRAARFAQTVELWRGAVARKGRKEELPAAPRTSHRVAGANSKLPPDINRMQNELDR